MKILLIHAFYTQINHNLFKNCLSIPPLGLLYLHSYLITKGYKKNVILDSMIENISYKKITKFAPQIVGFTVYAENFYYSLEVAATIKKTIKNVKIVFGGIYPSTCYTNVLKSKITDFVVIGEGEETFYNLVNAINNNDKNYSKISGIAYLENNRIMVNTFRKLITDIDQLPYPDFSKIKYKKYSSPFIIHTTRGCPGKCIFCSASTMWNNTVRLRSAKNIFQEFEIL